MKITWLLLACALVFGGCDNGSQTNEKAESPTELSPEVAKAKAELQNLLDQVRDTPQKLTAPASKKSTVKGKKGTIIHVDPQNLETEDGSPLGKKITVELLELTQSGEFLRNNVPTVSNGRLLVSGGAYYINMISDGKQLKVKEGKSLEVQFPKIAKEKMSLFYGQVLEDGGMNWVGGEESFVPEKKPNAKKESVKPKSEDSDPVGDILAFLEDSALVNQTIKDEKRNESIRTEMRDKYNIPGLDLYSPISFSGFGWINCDRFLEEERPLFVINSIERGEEMLVVNRYLLFKSINSTMFGQNSARSFLYIPKGEEVELIVVGYDGNDFYYSAKSLVVTGNMDVESDLVKTSVEDLRKKLERF